MDVSHGVNEALEAIADALIVEDLEGITSHSAKKDVLTDYKVRRNESRELLLPLPERSTRLGMYGRVRNRTQTHLNAGWRGRDA